MGVPQPPFRDQWAENQVATYAAMVQTRTHFAQAVYGDGEWQCILGTGEGNVNGERYTPELREALTRTLTDPVGQWCVLWPGRAGRGSYSAARAWIAEHPGAPWIPFRPLGWASVLGLLRPFWVAARKRHVILVGPGHMARLPQELAPDVLLQVPESSAWTAVDETAERIHEALAGDDLVLFASGLASNLAIHTLWPALRGRATLIDIGATLDPYCGVFSRRVYRDPLWRNEVMEANIP